MSRKKTLPWPLAANVETFFHPGPKRPGIGPEILQFIRETADPSEWSEGVYYESQPEEKTIGTLPTTPDYIQPLASVDLSSEEWRRIVVHVMRRLAKRHPELARQYAYDVEIFAALKNVQSLGDKEHPGYIDPEVLAVRLENDCPILPQPTETQLKYLEYARLRNILGHMPREQWADLLGRLELPSEDGSVYHLPDKSIGDILTPQVRKNGRPLARTAQHVALEIIATLFDLKPEALRSQFARLGLPLRLIGPSKRKQREMCSLPIKKFSKKMRSSR